MQKHCDAHQNAVVNPLAEEQLKKLQQELNALPSRLEQLKRVQNDATTDPIAGVAETGHSVIGYTADMRFQRINHPGPAVTQAATDNASLEPMVGL